jgi:hypothetical protein
MRPFRPFFLATDCIDLHGFLLCGWGFEPLRELRGIKFYAFQA